MTKESKGWIESQKKDYKGDLEISFFSRFLKKIKCEKYTASFLWETRAITFFVVLYDCQSSHFIYIHAIQDHVYKWLEKWFDCLKSTWKALFFK